jgi:repressor LexA
MVKTELTEKQTEILDYILNYSQKNGFPPTKTEIAKYFNQQTTTGIVQYLKALEKKGFIKLLKNVARGIQIVKPSDFGVPVFGEIAAGSGLLAEENISGRWDPIKNGDIPKGTFALKVIGESMIEAGIFPNDILFVDPNTKPKSGDIGAVIVDGEATVKYIFYGNGTLTLEPANKMMQKRVVETDYSSLNILGSVIAMWRQMKLKRNV